MPDAARKEKQAGPGYRESVTKVRSLDIILSALGDL